MLISKWRARSHRHFGAIHVPIVELEIADSHGQFCRFSLCADSGAVISLLPRSAADMLGLEFAKGRAVQLGGVGQQPTEARVHELEVRLENLPITKVPFAVAVHDRVPGLLGRLGVFDIFEVTFDALRRETRIRGQ